jgi:hypothetical protein
VNSATVILENADVSSALRAQRERVSWLPNRHSLKPRGPTLTPQKEAEVSTNGLQVSLLFQFEVSVYYALFMRDSIMIPVERIEKAIYLIRGEKVMLDRDLAELYEVTTAGLNQAVRRNRERFPGDFMFQLTRSEVVQVNRSQIVIGSQKHRDPEFRPYAFTEQGVAMLSSVLRSKRAVTVNIEIVRAFVKLRQMLASNTAFSRRLDELESNYDHQFKIVFDAIRQLMSPPVPARKQIGFRSRSLKK